MVILHHPRYISTWRHSPSSASGRLGSGCRFAAPRSSPPRAPRSRPRPRHSRDLCRSLPPRPLRLLSPAAQPRPRSAAPCNRLTHYAAVALSPPSRPTGAAFRLRFGRYSLPSVLPCAPPSFRPPLFGCCATLSTLRPRAGHTFALRVARSLRYASTRRPPCSPPLLFALSPPRCVCTCAAGVSGCRFAAPCSPRAAPPRARGIAATAPPGTPCGHPRPPLRADLRCPPQRPKGRLIG